MRHIAKLSIVGLGLVLAACQHAYVGGGRAPASSLVPRVPCAGSECPFVDVDVRAGCPSGLNTVEFGNVPGPRVLRWRIVNGPGWQFSQDQSFPPIHFTTKHDASVPFGRVGRPRFPGPDNNTMVVPWDRRGDGTGDEARNSFNYALNLVDSNGKPCTIDPWIIDK